VTFDTTAALTNYRLAFLNDSYTLYADDIPILTGLLRNYTNHIGPIDPYETPRFIFFGDNTTSAQVTIQFSYAELTVATPNGDGTGPGGVGSTDGTSALHLWLRADGDVFTDGGCSTAVSANDDPVACWGDHSGYGNNAAQGATAPLYQTGVINGQPTIQLNGTSDYFSLPDFVSGFTAGEFFVALQAAADPPAAAAQSGAWDFGTAAATSHYPFTDGDLYDGWGSTIRRSVTPGTSLAQFNLYNSGSQSGRWTNRLNGSILLDDTAANTVGFTSAPTLGRSNASTFLDGDIAEAILFNAVLNSAQRTILENYASAKYDLTLASTDVYAGDTAANGDYDLNVAGIGAESDGNQTEAHASGLVLAESASSLAAGEYLLAGHRTANNGNNNVDVPGGVTQRWQRVWYVDKTGGVDATLTFDFSEAGMDGLAGDPANYVLLYSAAQAPFSWSVLMSGATAVTIDQTAFTVTNANLNAGYYTLGTGDVVNSPTAVTLTQISSSPDNSSLMSLTLIIMLVVGGLVVFKKRLGHNPLSKQ
ncbi:MAG: hypothetical protein GY796_33790, partial [Chloroflexi bacterium]|nr:hypothetical protein [Chloroflexota bacterium]